MFIFPYPLFFNKKNKKTPKINYRGKIIKKSIKSLRELNIYIPDDNIDEL